MFENKVKNLIMFYSLVVGGYNNPIHSTYNNSIRNLEWVFNQYITDSHIYYKYELNDSFIDEYMKYQNISSITDRQKVIIQFSLMIHTLGRCLDIKWIEETFNLKVRDEVTIPNGNLAYYISVPNRLYKELENNKLFKQNRRLYNINYYIE